MAEKNRSPVKAVSLMMIITLAGKVTGLLRDRLLTINYGTGMEANAFLTASRIPRVFFDAIFASAIAASFIPVFNEYMVKQGKKKALEFSGNFITVIGIFSLILTALGMVFSEQLSAFFADGFDAETAALCASLTRIMFPTVLFTGVAYSFVGILQSMDEFNAPAAISLVANGVIIIYYFTFDSKFGVIGLSVAFLIAWFAQAAVQAPSLIKRGFRFYPSAKIGSEGMKKVFALMLPVMVSTWVIPINQTVNAKFGSRLFDGAGVSAIELSYNLYTIIVGVFVLSVTNFIFPRLSRLTAEKDSESFKKTISGTMHVSLFVVIPMTAGLMVLARPIVEFIYGGGEFGALSAEITSRALFWLSLGMVGYALQAVLSRAFFAEQKGRVPLIAGAAAIIVNIALCFALTERFDVAGLGIASAVSSTVNGAVLLISLSRRGLGFVDRGFLKDMLKIAISTGVMTAAAWYLYTYMLSINAGKLLTLAVPILLAAAVYGALSFALGLGEMRMAANMIKKLIKRR